MNKVNLRLHFKVLIFSLILLIGFSACETPEKVLKSNDLEYKIKTAKRWYEKKEYVKCIPVFEELMGLMKGTKSTEEIYYMYCWANYKQGDYMISAYHFNNFTKLYPNSDKAEECGYMSAKSNSKQSPKYQLDQTNTFKAIETYQAFVNNYPESSKVDTANKDFILLRKKLERKSLSNADLYFKTEKYKAAATAFRNILTDYPDIDNSDYIYYMIMNSLDKYAENSVPQKKKDRYHDVFKAYEDLKYRFPKSKYLDQAIFIADNSHFKSVIAEYEYAKSLKPELRSAEWQLAIEEIEEQKPQIKEAKQLKKIDQLLEKAHYLWFKNDLFLANESTLNIDKAKYLEESIKTYYKFVDKYKTGKYAKSAEMQFVKASDKLKKIKSNG